MCILNPIVSAGALHWFEKVHSEAVKASGLQSEARVWNAFINMFAKSGSVESASQVFKKMAKRDVITWTLMIGAYAASGHGKEACQTFLEMQREGVQSNAVTYMTLLNPCAASSGALEWVRQVRSQASKAGLPVADARVEMLSSIGTQIARVSKTHITFFLAL